MRPCRTFPWRWQNWFLQICTNAVALVWIAGMLIFLYSSARWIEEYRQSGFMWVINWQTSWPVLMTSASILRSPVTCSISCKDADKYRAYLEHWRIFVGKAWRDGSWVKREQKLCTAINNGKIVSSSQHLSIQFNCGIVSTELASSC